ncbi:autotransporter outer membrane beta-barrel domain-containing protein [uncultured Pseudomonas sp.]|uniref:autotransporter outer membrane beta-barrel domain-containing protein n=1 Tax=uncultured Pseudomonas sp. TaxID=114707 RepID=UPI0025827411|nr:autotransporter outer membrane beta-barrel domain-containing protein [uncultured Pseudomonas sp.]
MKSIPSFTLNVVTRSLRAPLLLLCTAPAWAQTTVDGELNIDASTASDSYLVNPRGQLNATGATTQRIRANAGSGLNLQGTTVDGGSSEGVTLISANGTISGNSSIRADLFGLRLARQGSVGSTLTVSDSRVEGGRGGASLSAGSKLVLENSTLVSNGSSGAVQMFGDASLSASGSTIRGARTGLEILADPDVASAAQVSLVGTEVEGLDGSAIVVGDTFLGPASANILVGAGSTLKGSNGTLLEVLGDSTADFSVDSAQLVGDIRAEAGSTANVSLDNHASLTGRLENVATLTLANQGRWTMVEDSQVGKLQMNGGEVRFGEANQYQRLTLGELSGNGTFIMDADFATGQTDFLEVTGNATGNHSLLVGSSGAEPTAPNSLHLVHVDSGDASFSLVNGSVDLGAFSYALAQRGNDWFLDGSSKVISPGTASVLALFNTAPTIWYGELTTLRGRMGELRLDQRKAGAWARAYGNQYNVNGQSGYKQTQQGFSLGADTPLPWGDGQWLAGVMAGHSSSDLNLTRGGSAEVKSAYLGLYATWLDANSGYYFDSVVKLNRFDNDSKVTLSDGERAKGSYDNLGVGGTVEFGRHIALGDGYFVEPYTQWSAVSIAGKDYHLDNGLKAQGDDTRSLLGKAGATLGRTFDLGQGRFAQPYVRAAYAHEFVSNNQVKVNDHRFDNDLAGSRGELGVGIAVALGERLQMHADFDYSNGQQIEQPWGANIGVSYRW